MGKFKLKLPKCQKMREIQIPKTSKIAVNQNCQNVKKGGKYNKKVRENSDYILKMSKSAGKLKLKFLKCQKMRENQIAKALKIW